MRYAKKGKNGIRTHMEVYMKKNIKDKIPGILIGTLLSVALILFLMILIKTKLLPVKYILLAGGLFLLFAVCVFFLTRDVRRLGPMICGCLMTMILLIVLMLGTPYLTQALNTLDHITAVDVEVAHIGIYVKNDSAVDTLSDLENGNVGILKSLDRNNTNETLEKVQAQVANLQTQEYIGLSNLADGLLQDEVDAIMMNSAFLELLKDMEGYRDMASQLREVYQHQTETVIEKPKENEQSANTQKTENRVFTMYLSGIDSREGLIAASRSDVNILATVNVDKRQVLLVSTPRDYYVPLSISDGIPDKLTHAGIYGIDVSMDTLEMLYDTQVDYYFRVNFSGFENIIDALGGITINSPQEFVSIDGYYFYEGENTLSGAEALAFARERYAFEDGDRQRGENQMAVIKAVIEKAMSPSLLANYADIMASVSGSFETSMPYDTIAGLVRDQLDKGGSWHIVTASVDGTGDYQVPYSLSTEAYVMIPDQTTVDAVIAKMQQVKNGEILE